MGTVQQFAAHRNGSRTARLHQAALLPLQQLSQAPLSANAFSSLASIAVNPCGGDRALWTNQPHDHGQVLESAPFDGPEAPQFWENSRLTAFAKRQLDSQAGC